MAEPCQLRKVDFQLHTQIRQILEALKHPTTNITNHQPDHDHVNPHNQARWVTPQVFVLALAMPSLATSARRV